MRTAFLLKHSLRLLLTFIAFLLIISAGVIWLLNLLGVIQGAWSAPLAVAFVIVSALLGLAQWAIPLPPIAFLGMKARARQTFFERCEADLSEDEGSLIVFATRKLRGQVIRIYGDVPSMQSGVERATPVVECLIEGYPIYVAVFRDLKPGKYSAYLSNPAHPKLAERLSKPISVSSGFVRSIDWRRPRWWEPWPRTR